MPKSTLVGHVKGMLLPGQTLEAKLTLTGMVSGIGRIRI